MKNNVNVDLMLQASKEEKEVSGIAYTVDLKRMGGRWLVESFFPTAEFRRAPAANGSRIVAQPDLAPTQTRDAVTQTSDDRHQPPLRARPAVRGSGSAWAS